MKGVIKRASGREHWTHHSAASACGEVAACLVRVPTDNIKQNMQVGKYRSLSGALASTLKAGGISKITRDEGAAALFKGLTPRVGWITVGGFIFFGAYEKATSLLRRTNMW